MNYIFIYKYSLSRWQIEKLYLQLGKLKFCLIYCIHACSNKCVNKKKANIIFIIINVTKIYEFTYDQVWQRG